MQNSQTQNNVGITLTKVSTLSAKLSIGGLIIAILCMHPVLSVYSNNKWLLPTIEILLGILPVISWATGWRDKTNSDRVITILPFLGFIGLMVMEYLRWS